MLKIFKSRKGDMSVPVIVAIVIGLTLLVIMIYLLWGKSKNLSEAVGCPREECSANDPRGECPAGQTKSYNPCSFKDGDQTKTGRCCVSESFE